MTLLGSRLPRREDAALLTGEARFVDDLPIHDALHAKLVRSPFAHARITAIDTADAAAMPGVVGVYTAVDLGDEFVTPLPCAWPVTPDMVNPPHFPLASGEVHYAGEPVAVVVAESRAAARDALEAVVVDYEELPAVVDLEEALSRHEACPHRPVVEHVVRLAARPRPGGRRSRLSRTPRTR